MKSTVVLAVTGLLAAFTAAAPLNKRDLKYITETSLVAKTDWVVQTVWVYPDGSPVTAGSAAPTSSAPDAYPTGDNGQYNPVHNPIGRPLSSYVVPVPTISSEASPSLASSPAWTGSMVTETIYSTTTIHRSTTTITPTSTLAAVSSAAYTPSPASSSVYTPPAPVSSAAPVASAESIPTSSSSGGSLIPGATFTGEMTHYDVGLGSCGITSTSDQDIVAIPVGQMDNPANPNSNPNCGKTVTITYGGKTKTATVVDTCEGCPNDNLDMSDGLFSYFAPLSAGRLGGMKWTVN